MNDRLARLKVLSAGILSLILTMGVARFAYTPMLPLMREQAGLGVSEAGWLAAINYLGYLSGALIASQIANLHLKDKLYRLGLLVAIGSTVLMGVSDNAWVWAASRFVAGLSSAAGLLLGSGLILNWLIRHDHRGELGIHFSGVGLGIAFCAVVVELSQPALGWGEQWYLLSALGLLLAVPAWVWLPPPDSSAVTRSGADMRDSPPSAAFLRVFIAAYFCAGVGYVVSATFIVAIIEDLPGLTGQGAWTFMVMGLAAAPACIAWDLIARRIGHINALVLAASLQIVGILLPLIDANLPLAMISAALFGATFIGVVSLVLTMAGHYYPTRPAKMMGKMTISYGVAQILAPAITGQLAERFGGYDAGLYIAAAAMAVGALLTYRLKSL